MKTFIVTINIALQQDSSQEELSEKLLQALRHPNMPVGVCRLFVLPNAVLTPAIETSKPPSILN